MELFLQQLLNGLVIGSTYAVVAIGFALVFTVLRVINFAHPEIFMCGMFSGLLAGAKLADSFFVILAGGALGAGLVGFALELGASPSVVGLLGAIPREGQEVRCGDITFRAERVQRRRVLSVLVTLPPPTSEVAEA